MQVTTIVTDSPRVYLFDQRTFCGVAIVCIAFKVLMTLARGLQSKIRPWVRADDERAREFHRLQSDIVAGAAQPVTDSAPPYDTYATEEDEQRYWEEAARGLRELQNSDAKYTVKKIKGCIKPFELPPLVMYYTPALPRFQRTKEERRRTPMSHKEEMRHRRKITPEIYIKWHWMTHPEAVGPISAVFVCPQLRTHFLIGSPVGGHCQKANPSCIRRRAARNLSSFKETTG